MNGRFFHNLGETSQRGDFLHARLFADTHGARLRFAMALLVSLALAAGLTLSILSWIDVCTSACAEGHQYKLFGLSFAFVGVLFFAAVSILWVVSAHREVLLAPLKLIIAAALGAELHFLSIQKFVIGKWCPLCLGIFACVALLAIIFSVDYLARLVRMIEQKNRSEIMIYCANGIRALTALVVGFVVVFLGVSKPQSVYAETVGADTLFFGSRNNPVEVYVFTDWFCPACRKVEPYIEKQAPSIAKKAKLYFIDVPIHEDSLNYTPYNLSFMLKEKTKYLKLRQKLQKLAMKDPTPQEAEVEQIAESLGTKYHQLDYAEVNQGIKYFQSLANKYGVEATPMIVIVHPQSSNKPIKLTGIKEIKKADFNKLIEEASKP